MSTCYHKEGEGYRLSKMVEEGCEQKTECPYCGSIDVGTGERGSFCHACGESFGLHDDDPEERLE